MEKSLEKDFSVEITVIPKKKDSDLHLVSKATS